MTPCVAVQFGGNAGGVTPSKFSTTSGGQVGVAVAVAVGVGVAVAVAVGVGDAVGVGVGVGDAVGVGVGVPPASMSGFAYKSNWCNVPFGFVPSQFVLSAHIA